jgi:hypothetical protein
MPVYDVTARKAHQWTMVALIAIGFVLGDAPGWILVGLAGLIMLVGRFWWPADVVRQLVWRVAEPRGWLARVERAEDHDTRRVARVLGGIAWLGGLADASRSCRRARRRRCGPALVSSPMVVRRC